MMQSACVTNSSRRSYEREHRHARRRTKTRYRVCFRACIDDKRRHDVISSSTRHMASIATRLSQFFHPFDLTVTHNALICILTEIGSVGKSFETRIDNRFSDLHQWRWRWTWSSWVNGWTNLRWIERLISLKLEF